MKSFCKYVFVGLLAAWCLIIGGRSAWAEVDGNWGYYYSDSDFTATITNYTGSSSSPTIPSKFSRRVNTGEKDEDGDYIYKTYTYKVTTLSGTFRNNTTITSVSLPTTVTTIGPSTFSGCTSLLSAPLHSGITSIGSTAFSGCTSITSVTVDSPVTLSRDCFKNCTSLESVVIGDQVRGLGEVAARDSAGFWYSIHPFGGCPKIRSFVVGRGIRVIPDYYFGNFKGYFPAYTTLEQVELPDSIASIGQCAFSGCNALTELNLTAAVTNIADDAFSGCSNLDFGKLFFPKLVTIGGGAFSGCVLLEPFEFSDTLTSIGGSAFSGCVKFKEVILGKNITTLGKGAFSGCTSITSVTVDSPVTLSRDCFKNCTSLESVVIGDQVRGLGEVAARDSAGFWYSIHPFGGCPKIRSFVVGRGIRVIPDYYFGNFKGYFPAHTTLEQVELPDSITSIGNSAFSGCNSLTDFNLPTAVTNISGSAFSGCSNLAFGKIYLPKLTKFNDSTFANCSGITGLECATGVTNIGSYAFQNCSNLSNVWFKGAPPSVGTKPFSGVASGARGHYMASYASEWLPQIGSDGKWQGLIMAEIPGPVLRVDSANPAEGSLTLAWDEPATMEGVTYSVYRSANDTYSATDLLTNGLTGTSWTDTAYWSAKPVLKPLNYWVVADGGGYGERASKPVETRNRFGVFVGLNEEQGFATDARLCRDLASGKGEFGDCTVFTGGAVDSDAIRGKVSELAEKSQPGDLFLLYISTHGGEGSLSMSGWLDDYDVAELQTDVRKFNPGVAVIGVIMACHSGSMMGNGVGSEKIISWLLDAGAADCRANIAWITSCGYGQVSPLYGNGGSTPTPFGCSFLRDGWQKGYADGPLFGTLWGGGDGDGNVTFYELARYAAEFNKGYSDDVAPAGVRVENDELLKRMVAGTAGPGGMESQPDAPESCTASQGHSDASIQVNWELSKDATVDNYWLFRKGPGESMAHCIARNAGNGEFFDPGTIRKVGESFWNPGGFSLKNLRPPEAFKIYTYYVRAVSPQGISEPSPEAMGFAGTTVMRQWLEALGISVAEGTGIASSTMSANGHDSVLTCYVAGLDPKDPTAAFEAELLREDGKWKAKPKGGEKEGRVYRVEGKKEMSDEAWTDVTTVEDLEAEGWHFFRVGVELAE